MSERPWVDYNNKDYASLREAMLALAREKLPEWTDHSPNDLGVVLLELFAYMGDIMLYYQDRIANESYLETAIERHSVVNLLRLIGYELRPARPASVDLSLEFEEPQGGNVQINKGTMFRTTHRGVDVNFQFRRESIDRRYDELEEVKPKKQTDRRKIIIPVIQVDGVTESPVIVGSSDGSPGQRFRLRDTPIIDGTVEIHVGGKDTPPWEIRPSLFSSLSADEHCVLRRDEEGVAWIEFGDGRYGKIPPQGHNNITATYAYGGGAKGNVAMDSRFAATAEIGGLKKASNEKAASGGSDAETIDEAVFRGPHVFRSGGRAVTAADFEAFAREFGAGKVLAYSPSANLVKLIVAPAGGGFPSDTFKEDLRNFLEDKRMLGIRLDIDDPTFVKVFVEGSVEIDAYAIASEVQQRIEQAIQTLLAFDTVSFGSTLYLSKFYEAIEAIDGVANVYISWFDCEDPADHRPIADEKLAERGRIQFGWDEIPRAGYQEGIKLRVVTGRLNVR